MKINMKIRSAAMQAAKKICSDYGMLADSPADALRGTDLDRGAVVEIFSTIIEEIRKIKA